jgi:chromosome segregation ATPase
MDQELLSYLDRCFRESSEQIRELREDNAQRFGQIDARLDQYVSRFDRLEAEIRYTNVALEDLRGQIQLVAEGVETVDGKLERFREETAQQFQEVHSLLGLSHAQLGSRASALENRVEDHDHRLVVLETARP